ncbi:MAG: hypothetical protein IJ762_05460 [Bacteroidaceae bacterium]|nr:hypothetical protein [Bacteroidaceae bacterium]MBR1788618.1 hypothetical protein [Bacteroidaceae bacterium]
MAEREKDEEILLTEKERTESSEQKEQTTSQRRRLWSSLFTEGESEGSEGKGLKDVMQAVQIDGKWFFKQIPLFLLILGGILLLVTNRYQAQQEIIEREQLIKDVEDWKFQSLTRSSELTTQTRQSKIEERLRSLGDSTLSPAKEPPFTINPND